MTEGAFVWIWLPGKTEPVVAGEVSHGGDGRLAFNYGQSYLARPDAIAIYLPELPLVSGLIEPGPGLGLAGALRDGLPDAWGRRVILYRLSGQKGPQADTDTLPELTYCLESGSDRIGALDFQQSPSVYVPRETATANMKDLLEATEKIDRNELLTPELDLGLQHGSSIGGARPKVMINDDGRKSIAKFSSSSDTYNVIKAEFMAMRLAKRVGLDVAPVRLERVAGRDVLLIERFDRVRAGNGWHRRAMVSALTMFGLDEMIARYASYEDLAEIIRHRFTSPKKTLEELFGRLVFNILCGNTDDHARNHAAFWDGARPTLTPAYDICPQPRAGGAAGQAMLISGTDNSSRLATCIDAAPDFHLDTKKAEDLIANQIEGLLEAWPEVQAEAELGEPDRLALAGRAFLNPFIFEGATQRLAGFQNSRLSP